MLLDTHIFLWWLFDDSRLSRKIREYVQNIENPVFISAATVWEISTKYRLGKLPKASSVAENVTQWVIRAGFQSLSITLEHAQLAGNWPYSHRDPFDRMLAAQAKLEGIPLATTDKALVQFSIDIVK